MQRQVAWLAFSGGGCVGEASDSIDGQCRGAGELMILRLASRAGSTAEPPWTRGPDTMSPGTAHRAVRDTFGNVDFHLIAA